VQTEIIKIYSDQQITAELKGLEDKYESIDSLHQKLQIEKCSNPDLVDDYMVWKALKEEEVVISEKIVLKTLDIYSMMSPKRMEILDYLTAHSINSIKLLAQELKRNYKNVYDDVKAMEEFGLVELVNDGRNKRPVTKINTIKMVPDKKAGVA
jgi:predicted transcriptional regulator